MSDSLGRAHFFRMKEEGLDDLSAFIEAFDYAKKMGENPVMALEGTRAEFEQFTAGITSERIERARAAWKFTD